MAKGSDLDRVTAIVLREMEGMSYEEISQVVSVPVGTVRSRIYYGKQALQSEYERTTNE